jgi:putative copper export protein
VVLVLLGLLVSFFVDKIKTFLFLIYQQIILLKIIIAIIYSMTCNILIIKLDGKMNDKIHHFMNHHICSISINILLIILILIAHMDRTSVDHLICIYDLC